MSTTRLTFGAILNTVSSTANTVTAVLDAANQGATMLTSYVSEAAHNQRIRQIADREDFVEGLIKEKAEQRATANLKFEKFAQQSESHSKQLEESYNLYTALLRGEPKSA